MDSSSTNCSNISLNSGNPERMIRESCMKWPSRKADIYELINLVGKGSFGKVYKAKLKSGDNELFALKQILMENEKEGFPITAIREAMLLKKIQNDNIINLIEIVTQEKNVFLVFEYMDHDLCGLLSRQIKFSPAVIKYIIYSILKGTEYLHSNNILHRDLKSSNVLVSNKGDIKIGDFGLARAFNPKINRHFTNRVVTLWYRSPELLLGASQYNSSVDVWSVG